jgi:hypothetical protein
MDSVTLQPNMVQRAGYGELDSLSLSGLLYQGAEIEGNKFYSKTRNQTGTSKRPLLEGKCFDGDGTDDGITFTTAIVLDGDFEIEFNMNGDDVTERHIFANSAVSGNGRISFTYVGYLNISNDSNTVVNFTGFTFLTGTDYKVFLVRTGTSVTLTVNDVLEDTQPVTGDITLNSAMLLRGTATSWETFDGKMWGVKIYKAGVLQVFYKMDEVDGTTSFDSSGNGNHGVITNATLSTFHATQDVYSYQNQVGYSNYFIGNDTLISPSIALTDLSFTFNNNGATTQFIIISNSATVFLLAMDSGSTSTAISGSYGTLVVTIDGVAFSGTRAELYTLLTDDENHEIVISNITRTDPVYLGGYSPDTNWDITSQYISNVIVNGVAIEGTTYVPRDEALPTLDVFGNTLQNSGLVKPYALIEGSNCGHGDGNDDGVTFTTAIVLDGDFEIEVNINADDVTGRHILANSDGGGSTSRVTLNDSGRLAIYDNAGGYVNFNGFTFLTGTDYKISLVRVGTSVTFKINGTLNDTQTLSGDIELNSAMLERGTATSWETFDGKMWGVKIYKAGVLQLNYPFSEGAGTRINDVSGNGNHGTATNITESTFWGSTQDVFHYNINTGFNKYMHFDGVDNLVTTETVQDISGAFDMTVSYIGTANQTAYIAHQGNGGGTSAKTISILANDSNVVVTLSAGSSTPITIAGANDGDFHTIRIISDGTTYEVFFDTISEGTSSIDQTTINNNFPLMFGGRYNNTIDAFTLTFEGSISNITVNGVAGWNGYGNTDEDWLDTVIPVGDERMYFDGADDAVLYGDIDVLDYDAGFKVKVTIATSDDDGVKALASKAGGSGTARWLCYLNSGQPTILLGDGTDQVVISGNIDVTDGLEHELIFIISNSNSTATKIFIDGAESTYSPQSDPTVIDSMANASPLTVGAYNTNAGRFIGIISDVSITNLSDTVAWSVGGYGNTDAKWLDQTGSNNGTVVGSPRRVFLDGSTLNFPNDGTVAGSPANIRIPKLTSADTDALGNTLRNIPVAGHNDAESTFDFKNVALGGVVSPSTANVYEGYALFDGSNDYISVPDNTDLDITNNLSVTARAKNDNAAIAGSESIIAKYDYGNSKREWLMYFEREKMAMAFGDPSDGSLQAIWKSNDDVVVNLTNTYGFTFASGDLKVYVNGAEVAGSVTTGTIPSTLYLSDTPLRIGIIDNGASREYHWEGNILDARIYNTTVLTAAQMLSIHNGTNITTNLVAHYPLIKDALDTSGNGNNGIVEGVTFPKVTLPDTYAFGDTVTNPVFKRDVSTTKEDRFLIYEAGLTGTDLTKSETYTDNI